MRIVLDANVFISGVLWEGNEAKIIKKCIEEELQNYTSLQILEEFERVLNYKKFQLTIEKIERLLQTSISFSIIVIPEIRIYEIEEDQTDNMFLECALVGNVDYIVSGNDHLLKLKDFRGIKIVNAKKLLKILGE